MVFSGAAHRRAHTRCSRWAPQEANPGPGARKQRAKI
jgi:hypothetical protein